VNSTVNIVNVDISIVNACKYLMFLVEIYFLSSDTILCSDLLAVPISSCRSTLHSSLISQVN